MQNVKERLPVIDNLKGFLIFCVVLGHLVEFSGFPYSKILYCTIYLFHMPAFVFLSGYCCKENESIVSIFQKYLYPYVIWQTIYILFRIMVLGLEEKLQFFVPYWHLWYLLSLFIWHCLIRFFKTVSKKTQGIVVLLFVVLGLFIGFIETGYDFLEISRVIVLFPFFFIGYYSGKKNWDYSCNKRLKRFLCVATLFVFVCLCMSLDVVMHKWMFHSMPYELFGYTWWIRLVLLIASGVITAFLCCVFPKKKLPLLTYIGQNSMPVYILHGFIILLLKHTVFFRELFFRNPGYVFLSAVLITLILSSKPVVKITKPFMRWPIKKGVIKKESDEGKEDVVS